MGSSEIHNGMKRLTEKAEPAYAQQTHVRSLQLLDHVCLMLSQQNKVSAVFKALDRGWTLKQTSHCRACRKTSKVILAWQVAVKVAVTSVNSFCLHPQSTCLLALWVCTSGESSHILAWTHKSKVMCDTSLNRDNNSKNNNNDDNNDIINNNNNNSNAFQLMMSYVRERERERCKVC